jgi:hypothetical protein
MKSRILSIHKTTGGAGGTRSIAHLDNNLYNNLLHLFAFYIAVIELVIEGD